MTESRDPYKVLQVDPEAEDEVIQAAYRRLAQKYHPDVMSGPEATTRMIAINAAWELLRDPTRRAALDLDRRMAARESERRAADAAARAAPSSGSGRPGPGSSGDPRWSTPRPASSTGTSSTHRPPETVSSDWTSGRSSQGGGYDPDRMRSPDGFGAAGEPPGNPTGSILNFGRYAGWSLGEIGRRDIEYIEWLDRMPIGRPYREEIDTILRKTGRRRSAASDAQERRGLFRRR